MAGANKGEPDPREQVEEYEKLVHELQTQIRFLEDETALLRRRLTNSPRQVKILEEQLLQQCRLGQTEKKSS